MAKEKILKTAEEREQEYIKNWELYVNPNKYIFEEHEFKLTKEEKKVK